MKWFQHHSDSHTNLKLRQILFNFGMEGYGVWWVCCELIAKEGSAQKITKEKFWMRTLEDITKLNKEKLQDIILFFSDTNLIDKESYAQGDLYIPKISEYCDDYTKRVRSEYGESKDRVRQDKIRIEENRGDKTKKDNNISFEKFWNLYPNKVGKKYVSNCWTKLNPDKALVDVILAAVEKQKGSRKWREGYIPNPSTWINQGRWEDDPDPGPKKAIVVKSKSVK